MTVSNPPSGSAAKIALRDVVETARSRRPLAEIAADGSRLCDVTLAQPEVRSAATIALYVSVGTEPGTGRLLEALWAGGEPGGKRILLPVVLRTPEGLDLDWAAYAGPLSLARARMGLLEPTTPLLGPDAIAQADLVLAPALAVSPTGDRLGRGAGCYDRALSRVAPETPVWAMTYDDEAGAHMPQVPTEPHDRAVDAVLTPSGLIRCRRA